MSHESSTLIKTTTSRKIFRFLDGAARLGQFSYMFGPTGRGKSFITRKWIEAKGNAACVRARTGVTQTGLRKQISLALFGDDGAREHEILQYFLEHPGFVLVVDEANHLLMDGNLRSAKCLDSVRDYHDAVQEAGGRMSIVFIFTEYSLDRLRKCRIAAFLQQFINRGDNHLDIPRKISRAYEIIPTVAAYLPDPPEGLINEACRFHDIRSLHKRLEAAVNHCNKTGAPVSAEILAGLQLQFETGSYEDEDADRRFLNS